LIRAFFAVPLSEQAEDQLFEYSSRLEPQLSRQPVRWIGPENYHITLAFLGDIQDTEVSKLKMIAQQVADEHFAAELQLSQLGWLPSSHKPKVLVVEPEQQIALMKLQADLARQLRDKGYAVENRRYRPHVTLARVKGRLALMPLNETLLSIETPLDELVLFSSQLTPQGAIYTPLFSVPLFAPGESG
jgi:2'-5' RNA ligase